MKRLFAATSALLTLAAQPSSADTLYRGTLCITDVQNCNPGDWLPACYTMAYRYDGVVTNLAFGDSTFRYVVFSSYPLGPDYRPATQRSITTFFFGPSDGVSMRFTSYELGNKSVKITGDMKGIDGYADCTLTFEVKAKEPK